MHLCNKIIKKVIIFIIMLCLTIWSGVFANGQEAQITTIHVALPMKQGFAEKNNQGQYAGYTYDYLNKISQYTNWQYEFIEIDGNILQQKDKIIRMFENGEIDIIGPIGIEDGFSDYCNLTGYPYGATYTTLSVLEENTTVSEKNYSTLKGLKIAVLKSDLKRIEELDKFCTSNDITYELIEYESNNELMEALKIGRADAFLGTSTYQINNTRVIAKFAGEPFYFATPKANFEVLNGLNMALNKIDQTDHSFPAKLYNKYFIDETNNLILTQAEKEYIANNPVLTVLAFDGIAPIQYFDKNGELKGISKNVMDEIAVMTGFKVEYKKIDKLSQATEVEDADILTGISYGYTSQEFPNMFLSEPYLSSSVVLYLNSSLKTSALDGKIYAAIRGRYLPYGIKEENVLYYNTGEETLDAVESGEADYGYGNAYSVSFYNIQNNYKNIVTVPQEKELREYSLGFINENNLLHSIINKSLSSIGDIKYHDIILEETSQAQRKITTLVILDLYGRQIALTVFVLIALLVFDILYIVKSNAKLKFQNKRYEILAEISNEYTYEYNVKKDVLTLSEKFTQLLGTKGSIGGYSNILKKNLVNLKEENISAEMRLKPLFERVDKTYEISLPLASGETCDFKVINTIIYGNKRKAEYIIGKIVDISEEKAEKQALLKKAQIDGLTGLYNASTSKDLIVKMLSRKRKNVIDAFLLLDVDYFKEINDNLGHYGGNEVLQDLAGNLQNIFRSTDILGRLGGDEFCVYLQNVPSAKFVKNKCQRINELVNKNVDGITVSVSIGVALVKEKSTYSKVFQQADDALYEAKRNGKSQFFIYNEENTEL